MVNVESAPIHREARDKSRINHRWVDLHRALRERYPLPDTREGQRMSAYMVMALGAFVVSIMAGLSGAGATPISRRANRKRQVKNSR